MTTTGSDDEIRWQHTPTRIGTIGVPHLATLRAGASISRSDGFLGIGVYPFRRVPEYILCGRHIAPSTRDIEKHIHVYVLLTIMFIIIKAVTPRAIHTLHRWKNGDQRKYLKSCFIRFFGNGTYLCEPCPVLFELLLKLKKEGENIVVFRADLIAEHEWYDGSIMPRSTLAFSGRVRLQSRLIQHRDIS